MSNEEIRLGWERAKRMAERIISAYYTGAGIEQAKKDQRSLALWVGMAREHGYVYNGCYDELLGLKL